MNSMTATPMIDAIVKKIIDFGRSVSADPTATPVPRPAAARSFAA
jgi:hypothetical protein